MRITPRKTSDRSDSRSDFEERGQSKIEPMTESSETQMLLKYQEVHTFLSALFKAYGMYEAEAEIVSARILDAELLGRPSLGLANVAKQLQAIDLGDADPRALITTVKETAAVVVLNGNQAVGHVAATKASELCVAKAKEVGIGCVVVGNSQNFGCAEAYACLMAEHGCIGFCTTSTSDKPSFPRSGFETPAFGKHPAAWAIPRKSPHPPLVYPFECDDAENDLAQCMQLSGQFGFAMAMVNSVMTAALANAKMPVDKTRGATMEQTQHFLLAINVSTFTKSDDYEALMDQFVQSLREKQEIADGATNRLPGEVMMWPLTERRNAGLAITPETKQGINEFAARRKVEVPW